MLPVNVSGLRSSPIVNKALGFAMMAHAGMNRKYTGDPYINHCVAVAAMVSIKTDDDDLVAAALLHDVVEDTTYDLGRIKHEFGERIAVLVDELTEKYTRNSHPHTPRDKRKAMERSRMANMSSEAKIIKLCDIAHNLSDGIVFNDPEFAVTYLKEKSEEILILLPDREPDTDSDPMDDDC